MDQLKRLVCVKWGQHSKALPCVEVVCVGCGAKLAMDAKNAVMVEQEGFATICIGCAAKEMREAGGGEFGGGMIEGRLIPDFEESMKAAEKILHRDPEVPS